MNGHPEPGGTLDPELGRSIDLLGAIVRDSAKARFSQRRKWNKMSKQEQNTALRAALAWWQDLTPCTDCEWGHFIAMVKKWKHKF